MLSARLWLLTAAIDPASCLLELSPLISFLCERGRQCGARQCPTPRYESTRANAKEALARHGRPVMGGAGAGGDPSPTAIRLQVCNRLRPTVTDQGRLVMACIPTSAQLCVRDKRLARPDAWAHGPSLVAPSLRRPSPIAPPRPFATRLSSSAAHTQNEKKGPSDDVPLPDSESGRSRGRCFPAPLRNGRFAVGWAGQPGVRSTALV
ncbi:hypothetical protein B0H67DRAFT_125604 [Lasiosphaeris hirsuta]|uniref:Uncharacterized protein n=1 Tax=Lasiosphaeris hirsuta TaxID=260670 RepID=A0AA40E7G6_9PEZI|nr:hypothetical protein B0H67DRAFT_125604 [Lasiosphaeris hirsuta]